MARKPSTVDAFVLDAFYRLRAGWRGSMMSATIPVSEVMAYCNGIGVIDPDERLRILDAIQALDDALLKEPADGTTSSGA